MNHRLALAAVILLAASTATALAAGDPPLAVRVDAEPLGRGTVGTVVGVTLRIAPEDRARIGDRARVVTSLLDEDDIVDRRGSVIALSDGSGTVYHDWPVGEYELRVSLAAIDSEAVGLWISDLEIPEMSAPFQAPEGAPPDAVALELTPPVEGAVRFLPPPDIGGIGALQLEVDAPERTTTVEFFHEGRSMGIRNRPPWTVSVPLGEIVRRTTVRAVARDARGRYLGEDAIVLNNPTGQLGVEILLAPDEATAGDSRRVTVSVTSREPVQEVSLSLDDETVARWAGCPCVVDLSRARLDQATILAADAIDAAGRRGDAVVTLDGGGGFAGTVTVELVEVPVVVLDPDGSPVLGLEMEEFTVVEDGVEVVPEGFGSTAELPLSLAVAIDTSGSMIEDFPVVVRAVDAFVEGLLGEGDEVTAVRFSWDAEVVVGWTQDGDRVVSALRGVAPEGGTSLHDAVVRSLEEFRGRRGVQALVLLTDGEDTTSRTGWDIALRFAHTMRIPIFPIGLGVGRFGFGSRGVLKELAQSTGGEAFFPSGPEELEAVYARISELLRSQYLIWYSSHSDKPVEQFRDIEVRVSEPDATVRTIAGYYPGK